MKTILIIALASIATATADNRVDRLIGHIEAARKENSAMVIETERAKADLAETLTEMEKLKKESSDLRDYADKMVTRTQTLTESLLKIQGKLNKAAFGFAGLGLVLGSYLAWILIPRFYFSALWYAPAIGGPVLAVIFFIAWKVFFKI